MRWQTRALDCLVSGERSCLVAANDGRCGSVDGGWRCGNSRCSGAANNWLGDGAVVLAWCVVVVVACVAVSGAWVRVAVVVAVRVAVAGVGGIRVSVGAVAVAVRVAVVAVAVGAWVSVAVVVAVVAVVAVAVASWCVAVAGAVGARCGQEWSLLHDTLLGNERLLSGDNLSLTQLLGSWLSGLHLNVGRVLGLGADLVGGNLGAETALVGDVLDTTLTTVSVGERVVAAHAASWVLLLGSGVGVCLIRVRVWLWTTLLAWSGKVGSVLQALSAGRSDESEQEGVLCVTTGS